MLNKPISSHVLSLDQENGLLRAVLLSFSKGKLSAEHLKLSIDISEDANVNPLYNTETNQSLSQLIKNNFVATTLSSQEVLVRQLEVALKKDKDIDAVLSFQAEPLLPFPVEEAVLDKLSLAQSTEKTSLALFATKKDHLQRHLELWKNLDIEPEAVSCEPASLAYFSQAFSPSTIPRFIVYIGNSHTSCVLAKEGKTLSAQSISSGFNAWVHAQTQDLFLEPWTNIDFESLDPRQHKHLLTAFNNWKQDVVRTLFSLAKQNKEEQPAEILLTGIGACLKNLGNKIAEQTNLSLIQISAPTSLDMSEEELNEFAIPIGTALAILPLKQFEQINFRKEGFTYPHPWKRIKIPLMTYFAASITLAATLFFFGSLLIERHTMGLRGDFLDLLKAMNKPYAAFEKEFSRKNALGSPEVISLENLTTSHISHRLHTIEKEITGTPDIFPLLPGIPRVSDLFAWLSTHPKMHDESGSIKIENVNYNMTKRPETKKNQEHYQVKVEIEFSSPTPKLAREFHDALIAPNDMVDPKAEVKWSSNRGRYRTSFFLKDKTVYPTIKPEGK